MYYIIHKNPWLVHEYGHTFSSRAWGPLYLFAVGLPSAISAGTSTQLDGYRDGVETHDFRSYEMNANKHAANYFGKYYGVDWDQYETFFPRSRYAPPLERTIPTTEPMRIRRNGRWLIIY